MDAGALKWDLLYVSNGNGTVTVYRYWKRRLVGTLTGFITPLGECVDKIGDVFITDDDASKIFEYAHGHKDPMNVLTDGTDNPYGCSVDPVTGKLAVANIHANIAVYNLATKKVRNYSTSPYVYAPLACAYDNKGNLFVTGTQGSEPYTSFAELPKNGAGFFGLSLLPSSSWQWVNAESIQWDGTYVVIGEENAFRFTITHKGNSSFEGETVLDGIFNGIESWITNFSGNPSEQGTQIVAASGAPSGIGAGSVMYWDYPAGGAAIASIKDGIYYPYGVTVSLKSK